jgi:hypothetical protein
VGRGAAHAREGEGERRELGLGPCGKEGKARDGKGREKGRGKEMGRERGAGPRAFTSFPFFLSYTQTFQQTHLNSNNL